MSEPCFRTLVAFEVLTRKEAFNGGPGMLADADSVTQIDRLEPEEITPAVFQRLLELHQAAATGYNVETRVLGTTSAALQDVLAKAVAAQAAAQQAADRTGDYLAAAEDAASLIDSVVASLEALAW